MYFQLDGTGQFKTCLLVHLHAFCYLECDPHDLLMGEQEDTVCANSSHGLQDTNGITVCYDSTAPGSSAVYGCAEDYYPEESNGSLENMVVCQVNGLWSDRLEFACLQNSKSGTVHAVSLNVCVCCVHFCVHARDTHSHCAHISL